MRARFLAWVGRAVLACWSVDAHADDLVSACADAAERGQELRSARKLVEARPLFVSCARRECPSAVRESCNEWLADLDRRTPSLVVGARDENGRDIAGVVVTLDGRRLPATVTSVAYPVNPGPHTLRCEAPGHDPASEDVVLREGEPLRVVSMTMKATGRVAASSAPSRREASPFPIVPIALGATSLVAFGVFGWFGATGASDYRRLEKDCAPDCRSDQTDGLRTKLFVADVALVVGIASGVTAAALFLFARPSPKTTSR